MSQLLRGVVFACCNLASRVDNRYGFGQLAVILPGNSIRAFFNMPFFSNSC